MESYDELYVDLLKTAAKIQTKPMDVEWRKRLNVSLEPEFKARADFRELRKKLLSIGGGEALIKSDENSPEEVQRLLTRGQLWTGAVKMRCGEPSQCHRNSRRLMEEGVGQLANGYALTPDGLWRPHSWIITPKGVVETTTPRIAYFGVLLTRQETMDEIGLD